jgi:hypothetical protein
MSFIFLLTRAQKLESGLNAGRQRAAACLFLDLQQQQRMLKIWMLWLPIADMMAALSFTNRPTDVKSAQERGAKDKRS